MCGIAGAFDASTRESLPLQWVREASSCLERRGPDAEGFAQGPGYAFAHRRLSIIDVEGSPQPWVDAETGDVLVFNGEIYNYRELRALLEAEGHTFRSEGDTEVLLRALQAWKRQALSRINGMFAFAYYRAAEHRLWLVRDHAGIKPLFFAFVGSRCYFASSLGAILTFPGIKRELDVVTFSHYLSTIRTTLGQRTLVQGVSTLEPGSMLELSPRLPVAMPHRYWQLPAVPASAKRQRDIREVAEEVRAHVRRAVQRQLISDVPLGGFLSGGLDSTIIASQASELTLGHYHCYTVGYEREGTFGQAYHEFPYVDLAAEAYNLRCQKTLLSEEDYLDDWQHLIAQKGQPLSTPNEVGIYRLARALRKEYTVALSGEGADEVFAGYTLPYASAWDFERAGTLGGWPQAEREAYQKSLRRLYGVDQFGNLTEHYFRLNSWVPLSLKFQILNPATIRDTQNDEPMFLHYLKVLEGLKELSPMDRYLHLHAQINLEGLLSRLDSSTMAASVEGRVPFTDPELMTLAFQLPDHQKLDWADDEAREMGKTLNAQELDQRGLVLPKRVLREGFRHEVPMEILTRPKVSFPTPFQECLAGPWRTFARETLLGSELVDELCNGEAVQFLLERSQERMFNLALWPLLNIALWAESHDISLPAANSSSDVASATTP
ncbi:MAG: asparagine synthase (glutamine-hydrolyzing) [Verrucomicrobiota bacterium JB022]|nr:asparagine synthase (glutamine-hydrolyzing) [Verrucomicrobiota bacterium JB022]